MEQAGNYDLAIQRGNWGYFASVTLSVCLEAADEGLVVEFETAAGPGSSATSPVV